MTHTEISQQFTVWWENEGRESYRKLLECHNFLFADAAREVAHMAWLNGAIEGVKAV